MKIAIIVEVHEMHIECRNTRFTYPLKTNHLRWPIWSMPLNEYIERNNKCNYGSFTFSCYVEILYIKYKTDVIDGLDKKSKYFKNILWKTINDQYFRYVFKINGELLELMKNSLFGQSFYSSNFYNEIFCIAIALKGASYNKQNRHKMMQIGLKLLRIPEEYNSLQCNVSIEIHQECAIVFSAQWVQAKANQKQKRPTIRMANKTQEEGMDIN